MARDTITIHFEIVHRSGNKHLNADSLSRVLCDSDDCDCYDGQTILDELPCLGCKTCIKRHKGKSMVSNVTFLAT